MTDPIADMLTRIRNGLRDHRPHVDMPRSTMREAVARVLRDEGFIQGFHGTGQGKDSVLRVTLKYGPDDESVIRFIRRVSKPSRRIYSGIGDLQPVVRGTGIAVLSTSVGVLSDREARAKRVGGEVLAKIW